MRKILVTGSEGLIGRALCRALESIGFEVARLDLRDPVCALDTRVDEHVRLLMGGCSGVVHLAAVSRVIDGEREPEQCRSTNIQGTRNVINAAARSSLLPWVVFGSSREVYGAAEHFPVSEDAPRRPVNVYGHTKVAGEDMIENLRDDYGNETVILRFSNVYGSISDHATRVVPAFARGAALGETLRVDGAKHVFDFNHLDDTVAGIVAVVRKLESGHTPPTIQFVSGTQTTLGELAHMCVELAETNSTIVEAPPRSFDVSAFCGDPSRARSLLGWSPRVPLRDGLARLISDFREASR